jgi:hypothetical protein
MVAIVGGTKTLTYYYQMYPPPATRLNSLPDLSRSHKSFCSEKLPVIFAQGRSLETLWYFSAHEYLQQIHPADGEVANRLIPHSSLPFRSDDYGLITT